MCIAERIAECEQWRLDYPSALAVAYYHCAQCNVSEPVAEFGCLPEAFSADVHNANDNNGYCALCIATKRIARLENALRVALSSCDSLSDYRFAAAVLANTTTTTEE